MNIKLIKFSEEMPIPVRKHYNDAGADVASMIDVVIPAHGAIKIPLGFGIELPDGYQAIVQPRSGLASRGIIANIAPIDSGYTGEIHALMTNCTDEDFIVEKGDRIGQLVIIPIILATYTYDENVFSHKRGNAGFGSTGVK